LIVVAHSHYAKNESQALNVSFAVCIVIIYVL